MKLEISNIKKYGKFTNMWVLNSTHLNNHRSNKKSQEDHNFRMNKNEKTYQSLLNAVLKQWLQGIL